MARDLHTLRSSKKASPSPASGTRRSRRRTRNHLPILRPVFPLDLRSKQNRPVCLWHRSAYGPAVRAQVIAGRAAMARLTVLLVGVVQNARYTLHRSMVKVPPWQRPSSALAAPQGTPDGSGELGTSGADVRPPSAKPLPWLLELAASKVADSRCVTI